MIQDEEGNEFLNVADTEDTGNTDTVYFSKVEQLKDVIPVNIHNGRSITISFEVWDEDTGNDDHERTISDLVAPFSGISKKASGSWSWKLFISDTNAEGDDKEATLWIQYRIVSCDSFFAGLGCSIYCKPVSGYYRCRSSGEKVCEERRTGDNCDTCIARFTGERCQSCSDNYYPEGTCDVHCPPDPNKYTCTNQGSKECLVNREGTDCENCVAHHYGKECSTLCQETASFTCGGSGEKDCKENFYPPQKCDTRCVPVTGNYTCNQTTGDKICAGEKEGKDCDQCQNRNKEGPNCDRCIKNYYADCTRYCKPDNEHYSCLENGTKICVDNTTVAEHDCRRPNKEWKILMIEATGGGIGLFLILLLTCIIVKVRKYRNKDFAEEILIGGESYNTQRNQYQEAIHPTMNNHAAYSSEETGDAYSRINRQEQANRKQHTQIGPDQNQDVLYSTIQSQPVYATVDKGDKYARLDRHEGTSNGTYSPETGEEPTYADVTFVRNERGDDAVTFRNRAQYRDNGTGQDGAEATYITVSQVIEERL